MKKSTFYLGVSFLCGVMTFAYTQVMWLIVVSYFNI